MVQSHRKVASSRLGFAMRRLENSLCHPSSKWVPFCRTCFSNTVKKSVNFTVKYLASGCSSFTVLFTNVYLQNIFRNQDMVGLCSPIVLENTFVGL